MNRAERTESSSNLADLRPSWAQALPYRNLVCSEYCSFNKPTWREYRLNSPALEERDLGICQSPCSSERQTILEDNVFHGLQSLAVLQKRRQRRSLRSLWWLSCVDLEHECCRWHGGVAMPKHWTCIQGLRGQSINRQSDKGWVYGRRKYKDCLYGIKSIFSALLLWKMPVSNYSIL